MTRRVVVIGGGTGIGRAVAERFLRNGCEVAIVGRRPDVLKHAAHALRALTADAMVTTHVADLVSPASVAALAQDLTTKGTVRHSTARSSSSALSCPGRSGCLSPTGPSRRPG